MFRKGDYLAVRNVNDGFYLCQAVENINTKKSKKKKYLVRWLEEISKDTYELAYEDRIFFNSIIDSVILVNRRSNLKLPKSEHDGVMQLLNNSLHTEEPENVCKNISKIIYNNEGKIKSFIEDEGEVNESSENNVKIGGKIEVSNTSCNVGDEDQQNDILELHDEDTYNYLNALHDSEEESLLCKNDVNQVSSEENKCTGNICLSEMRGEDVNNKNIDVIDYKVPQGDNDQIVINFSGIDNQPFVVFSRAEPEETLKPVVSEVLVEEINQDSKMLANEIEISPFNINFEDQTQSYYFSVEEDMFNAVQIGMNHNNEITAQDCGPFLIEVCTEENRDSCEMDMDIDETLLCEINDNVKEALYGLNVQFEENNSTMNIDDVSLVEPNVVSLSLDKQTQNDIHEEMITGELESKEDVLVEPNVVSLSFDNQTQNDIHEEMSTGELQSKEDVIAQNQFFNEEDQNDISDNSDDDLDRDCLDEEAKKVGVSIPAVSPKLTRSKNKLYDQKHSCYYCDKLVNKMSKHLERVHYKEIEVAKILAMTKGSKKRRFAFLELTRMGDYYYNCEVLIQKKGELLLLRRPTTEEKGAIDIRDYVPCPHCLGFLLKKHLWSHVKYNCPLNDMNESVSRKKCKSNDILGESLGLISHTFSSRTADSFNQDILATLRKKDASQEICLKDNLILRSGMLLYEKWGNTKCDLIRQNMRRMGRLVEQVNKLEPKLTCLADCLDPINFDIVVSAVKEICKTKLDKNRRPEMEIPSLALKIGNGLRRVASIQKGIALRNKNDMTTLKTMKSFLTLMDIEWAERISSMALTTMSKRKLSQSELLPLATDLLTLNKYLDNEIKTHTENLKETKTESSWSKLAKCTLARVIIFNKKRSGEASRMTVENYTTRPNYAEENTEEIKASLSPLEQKLLTTVTLIYIVGKRQRNVPVLLTGLMKAAIDTLLEYRPLMSCIKPDNIFLFPLFNSDSYIRGHDCLRVLSASAGLEKPELVTSTRLRKYVATVTQVMDLKENECDWLARHLGHDIRVHRQFYRLQESAVELTKVSRLLLAVDSGKMSQYAGKELSDVNIDDMSSIEDEDHASDNDEDHASDNESVAGPPTAETHDTSFDEAHLSDDDYCPGRPILRKTNPTKGKKSRSTKSRSDYIPRQEVSQNAKKQNAKKVYWSPEEKGIVLQFFRRGIKNGEIPGKELCESFLQSEGKKLTRKVHWTDVKFCVYNYLQKLKRDQKKC